LCPDCFQTSQEHALRRHSAFATRAEETAGMAVTTQKFARAVDFRIVVRRVMEKVLAVDRGSLL